MNKCDSLTSAISVWGGHCQYSPRAPLHPDNICRDLNNFEASNYEIFFQPRINSCVFGPNIPFSILFSSTCSLSCYLNVKNQVPHTYKTDFFFLSCNIYVVRWQTGRQKILKRMATDIPRTYCRCILNFFMNSILVC